MKKEKKYNNHSDHPYIKLKSNIHLDLSPKAFTEWFTTYELCFDDKKYLNKICEILNKQDDQVVLRFGKDTSGNDDTGLIDRILTGNYKLTAAGILEEKREDDEIRKFSFKYVNIETIIDVLLIENEIANSWENDPIYNGYYLKFPKKTFDKIEKEKYKKSIERKEFEKASRKFKKNFETKITPGTNHTKNYKLTHSIKQLSRIATIAYREGYKQRIKDNE